MFDFRAQGALEYLLMIGAAILVVAIVIIAISGLIVETKDQNVSSDYENQMDDLTDLLHKGESLENLPSINTFLADGVSGTISGNTISVILPSTSTVDLSFFTPSITYTSGASISPSGPQNFIDRTVIYTVTAADENVKSYSVNITKQVAVPVLSSAKQILSFNLSNTMSSTSIDEVNHLVNIVWQGGQSIVSSAPNITISDYATISPASSNIMDFTTPKTYTVTAQDGSTRVYTVTVFDSSQISSEKQILSFNLQNTMATTVINEDNHSIQISWSGGQPLAESIPIIEVSAGASVSPASGTAANFENMTIPASYVVTAQDQTSQTYMVFVFNTPSQLTWSNVFDAVTWDNAITTCSNWGGRLPSNTELVSKINQDYYLFEADVYHWTGTTTPQYYVILVAWDSWMNSAYESTGLAQTPFKFVCVK